MGLSGTKKALESIGKTRRTLRPGFPSPAILSACSMDGAVICWRCVRAPSPISAVTLIIFVLLCSCKVLEPDMGTLGVPLSREVGDGFLTCSGNFPDLFGQFFPGLAAQCVEPPLV